MGRGENAASGALLDFEVQRSGLGIFESDEQRIDPVAAVEALKFGDESYAYTGPAEIDPEVIGQTVKVLALAEQQMGADHPELRAATGTLAGKVLAARHGADHYLMDGSETAAYLLQLSGGDQAGSLRYAQPFKSDGHGGWALNTGGAYHLTESMRGSETLCGKHLTPLWRIGSRYLLQQMSHGSKKIGRCKACYAKAAKRGSDLELHKLLQAEAAGGRAGNRGADRETGDRIIAETARRMVGTFSDLKGTNEEVGNDFLLQMRERMAEVLANETLRTFEPMNGHEIFTAILYPVEKHHWHLDEQLQELRTYLLGLRVEGGLEALDSKERLRIALVTAYSRIEARIGDQKIGRDFISDLMGSLDYSFSWSSKQAFERLLSFSGDQLNS